MRHPLLDENTTYVHRCSYSWSSSADNVQVGTNSSTSSRFTCRTPSAIALSDRNRCRDIRTNSRSQSSCLRAYIPRNTASMGLRLLMGAPRSEIKSSSRECSSILSTSNLMLSQRLSLSLRRDHCKSCWVCDKLRESSTVGTSDIEPLPHGRS